MPFVKIISYCMMKIGHGRVPADIRAVAPIYWGGRPN